MTTFENPEQALELLQEWALSLPRDEVIGHLTRLIHWNAQQLVQQGYDTFALGQSEVLEMQFQTLPALIAAAQVLKELDTVEQQWLAHSKICILCQMRQADTNFDIRERRREVETRLNGKTPICDTCFWGETYLAWLKERRTLEGAAKRVGSVRMKFRERLQGERPALGSEKRRVYTLTDPRTKEVWYVGQTNDIKRRLWQHMKGFDGTPARRARIKELKQHHLEPVITVVEEVEGLWAESREFRWILHYLQQKAPLTNEEASYPHFVRACQEAIVTSFLTEPLDSPAWEPLIEAYALDWQEHWEGKYRPQKSPESVPQIISQNVNDLMTTGTAAKLLGISRQAVYHYIDGGKLTSMKIAGTIMLPGEQVRALKIERNERKQKLEEQ